MLSCGLSKANISDKVAVTESTCIGRCSDCRLYVYPDVTYKVPDAETADRIVKEHFVFLTSFRSSLERGAYYKQVFPVFGDVSFSANS